MLASAAKTRQWEEQDREGSRLRHHSNASQTINFNKRLSTVWDLGAEPVEALVLGAEPVEALGHPPPVRRRLAPVSIKAPGGDFKQQRS